MAAMARLLFRQVTTLFASPSTRLLLLHVVRLARILIRRGCVISCRKPITTTMWARQLFQSQTIQDARALDHSRGIMNQPWNAITGANKFERHELNQTHEGATLRCCPDFTLTVCLEALINDSDSQS